MVSKVVVSRVTLKLKAMRNGASNEIKENEVCKKCPKVNPYCNAIFDPIMSKPFWMFQNESF